MGEPGLDSDELDWSPDGTTIATSPLVTWTCSMPRWSKRRTVVDLDTADTGFDSLADVIDVIPASRPMARWIMFGIYQDRRAAGRPPRYVDRPATGGTDPGSLPERHGRQEQRGIYFPRQPPARAIARVERPEPREGLRLTRPMPPVAVRILHPLPDPAAGPLVRWVAEARATLAQRHRRGFEDAGAKDVAVVAGSADGRDVRVSPPGAPGDRRSRRDRRPGRPRLGFDPAGDAGRSTSVHRRGAARMDRVALANDRFSADIVAIARADGLPEPSRIFPGDNALPRWLSELAGYEVRDLKRRWRLGVDIDGPAGPGADRRA